MGAERWAMLALMVGGLLQSALVGGETLMVGGDNGWTFPPNGIASYYDDWAKENVFYVGDILFFDYQFNFHNVLEVTQADVASCTTTNPINTYNQANATVTLDRTGYYGFICGFPSHCVGNMKLELTVLADGTPAPSPVAPAGGPSEVSGPTGAPGPLAGPGEKGKNGASGVRSAPAVTLGALFAGCAALLL